MRRHRLPRALYAASLCGMVYSALVVLSFGLLYGPVEVNRVGGVLLEALLSPLGPIGAPVADKLMLLAVFIISAGSVLGFALVAFVSWLFMQDATVDGATAEPRNRG